MRRSRPSERSRHSSSSMRWSAISPCSSRPSATCAIRVPTSPRSASDITNAATSSGDGMTGLSDQFLVRKSRLLIRSISSSPTLRAALPTSPSTWSRRLACSSPTFTRSSWR
jgi:hypothetical protein